MKSNIDRGKVFVHINYIAVSNSSRLGIVLSLWDKSPMA